MSRAIGDIEYELAEEKLTVLFTDGSLYVYHNVPRGVAYAFKSAASKGAFFNQNVKGHFNYDREG